LVPHIETKQTVGFEVRHPHCVIQNIINGVKNSRNTPKGILAKMLG